MSNRKGTPRNPNNNSTQRQCTMCKEIKPLDRENFYHEKRNPYGFSFRCIDCHKEVGNKRKPRTEEQKIRDKEKKKQRYHKVKLQLYKAQDKKKGFETNLTHEFVKDAMNSPCFYCGFPSTGLDRIDNTIGHTIENCVSCCMECNIARMDNFTSEEMKIIGQAIKLVKINRVFNNK